MKRILCSVASLLVCVSSFAQPTSAPAPDTLMHGDLTFSLPDGWKMEGRSNDGRRIGYSREHPKAVMVLNVDPQVVVLPDSAAGRIGATVLKQIRDNAAANNLELTMQPKMETDDRFFLRVHHKYAKEIAAADQLQLYRVMGLDLVACAVTVFGDSADESKEVFSEAEKTLLSVKSGRASSTIAKPATHMKPATRPTALPNAKILFNAPGGWDADTNDNSSGIVATYHNPAESFDTIVVSVRPLPDEAKKDPKIRDALVDEIVSGEKATFKFDGASVVGDAETVRDNRFLKKEKTKYERPDTRIIVTSRQRRIGDVVVSVAMASLEASSQDVDRLADEVAMSLRAAPK